MITTRQINVNLSKEKLKFRQVTTKNINTGLKVEPPKAPITVKAKSVTTHTLADVADIVEKKRRDDITKEAKALEKARKKAEKVAKAKDEKVTEPPKEATKESTFQEGMGIYQDEQNELIEKEKSLELEVVKKPWNKMNGAERKVYQAEKAREKE